MVNQLSQHLNSLFPDLLIRVIRNNFHTLLCSMLSVAGDVDYNSCNLHSILHQNCLQHGVLKYVNSMFQNIIFQHLVALKYYSCFLFCL
jgi:zinc transporter ZupT